MDNIMKKKLTQSEFNKTLYLNSLSSLINLDLSDVKFDVECDCLCGSYIYSIINYYQFYQFENCILPDVDQMLLIEWGELSFELTSLCIAYDQSLHPDPERFGRWALGDGKCPYVGIPIKRAIKFAEKKSAWKKGLKPPPIKELILMILNDKGFKGNDFASG